MKSYRQGKLRPVNVTITIDVCTLRDIKKIANDEKTSVSRFVRESIYFFIEKRNQIKNSIERSARLKEAKKKGGHSSYEWKKLKRSFDNRCVACGSNEKPLTKDHITPLYAGGSDSIENIQPLCLECNVGNIGCLDYREMANQRMIKKLSTDIN